MYKVQQKIEDAGLLKVADGVYLEALMYRPRKKGEEVFIAIFDVEDDKTYKYVGAKEDYEGCSSPFDFVSRTMESTI